MITPVTSVAPLALDDSHRIAGALSHLPTNVRHINEIYLRHIAARSMIAADEAQAHVRQMVTVFLRHDQIKIFAVVFHEPNPGVVGMADFVSLQDVIFHVNAVGYQQTLEKCGPLPNHRTVHAYLTGEMTAMSDQGETPPQGEWSPVCYNPTISRNFFLRNTETPIYTARRVLMTPGLNKVWVGSEDENVFNSIAVSQREVRG
jgi:hypothetical protein